MSDQLKLFQYERPIFPSGRYLPVLTINMNRKGVIDVDTVKGCSIGMKKYPNAGCYGECYAYKTAKLYGHDFTHSVSRKIVGREHRDTLNRILNKLEMPWFRIGVFGDPCHDWQNTLVVCRALRYEYTRKYPVIITKHWIELSDDQLSEFGSLKAVVNTSVSGMDTDEELTHRIDQFYRIKSFGIKSVIRLVSCRYGTTKWARRCNEKQDYIYSLGGIIDTPLRVSKSNARVLSGEIISSHRNDSVGGGKNVSLNNPNAYLGTCKGCADQCGVDCSIVSNPRERVSWLQSNLNYSLTK